MSFTPYIGPESPKKKFHWTEGKESLEESIHNVKPLNLNMAHSQDNSNRDPSESSVDEVIEVEESTNVDDNESFEEVESVVEEEILESDDEGAECMVVDENSVQNTQTASFSIAPDQGENDDALQKTAENAVSVPAVQKAKPSASPVVSPSPYRRQHDVVDQDDDEKDLGWKKPEWTKSPVLRNTSKGKVLKDGATLSAPITKIAEVAAQSKDLSFKKPDWTTNVKLKSTGKGEVLKTEGNLAKPITSLPHIGKDFGKNEMTILEKSHASNSKVVEPAPKPEPKHVAPTCDTRSNESTPSGDDDDDGTKKIEWTKPDWTKKQVLKGSSKGEKLKAGATLSRPIGGIKPIEG